MTNGFSQITPQRCWSIELPEPVENDIRAVRKIYRGNLSLSTGDECPEKDAPHESRALATLRSQKLTPLLLAATCPAGF